MTDQAKMGHNNPPSPMEACATSYEAVICEAHNWADGAVVDTEEQMNSVDSLIKDIKSYRSALTKAGKEYTDPAHKAWKGMVAEVGVYNDDADLIQASLVAIVAPFKAKLVQVKEDARRAAYDAARAAERKAAEAAALADAGNIEQMREAAQSRQAALDAQKAAQASGKDTVKGLRTVTKHEVTDMRDLVNWIAKNDKPAMSVFAVEYARRNHKEAPIDGVRVWTEREAF
jgi:hypothetical protein